MERRGFLAAILAAGVAPVIAKAGVLMPVRQLVMPPKHILWGDGEHDDTAALQALLTGGVVVRPEGQMLKSVLRPGYRRAVYLPPGRYAIGSALSSSCW